MQLRELPDAYSDLGIFPLVESTTPSDGPAVMGGSLAPEYLIDAYRKGYFPWFDSDDYPITWYSPDPRLIIVPNEIHVSRRLQRKLRQGVFQTSSDTSFEEVISACARPRPKSDSTWITPKMIDAYTELHTIGLAHSIEVRMNSNLVGGIYGISIGKHFYGESMFSTVNDASKIALVTLAKLLAKWDFELIDCQIETEHLVSMGAKTVARADFIEMLNQNENQPTRLGMWSLH